MLRIIFLVVALLLFLFAAFGGAILDINLVALGLAFFVASFLVVDRGVPPNA